MLKQGKTGTQAASGTPQLKSIKYKTFLSDQTTEGGHMT
jgi:hypothetical protein